ncbi:MAG: COG1361 S-layer family protein [Candidatus Nanohalobium sp.]
MKRITLFTALMVFTAFAASQTTSNIEINLENSEPTPLQTSEYADLWLEVENTGNAEAQNLDLSFLENYPFSVEGGDRKNWSINSLQPGETYQIHLQARVDENAVQGNNTLNFRVDTSGISYVEKVPVEVRSDRNVLAVKDIEFPGKVAPGTSAQMKLELENLADSQLKNIEVSLDVSGQNLPVATSDSSTKNIEAVSAGESVSVNYTLNIDESAENGVYKLPITISFENEAGTEFEQSTTTGVNVGGEPRLDVGLSTEEALTGGTREITFRLVNRGHGAADFVSLELQENDNVEVIGSNKVYIGSMDPDDFQNASFKVNVNAEQESVNVDEVKFPVQVTYSDSGGQQVETQKVSAELYTQKDLQKYGLGTGGSPLPLIVVALLLVGGGVYYWRRKRKE